MATSDLGATSDFSPIASRYDATRDVPQPLLAACFQRFVHQGLLPAGGVILDAGCGTGQMSHVLAGMGYEVRGYDISREMVAIAQAKCHPEWRARYAVADVRSLPESGDSFDGIVVSKLFQHVGNWQAACQELVRVLRPGACIVQLTDRGAFGNVVRKYFAHCAGVLGYTQRFIGLTPYERTQLAEFFAAHGCESIAMDVTDLSWEKQISYGDALSQLQQRLFAEFWYLPGDVYERILSDTSRWIDSQPGGPGTIEVMTPYLRADVFRKFCA